MIEIHSVALTKVVSFDDAVFQIDSSPLTFIYGQNFDAQVDEGLPGNGAGKSLLCATIPNVRFSAPPSAKQKKAKKDLLYKKGSAIELHFHGHDGNEYIIEQLATKFNIFKDGEDQQLKTIPHAEKYIEEIFPLTDVEFYTTAYVATQRRHSIQSATDSERLDIITSIFKLDYFSKIREHFARKQREIKDNEIRLQVLQQTLLSLKKKIKGVKSSVDKNEYGKCAKQQAHLSDKIKKLAADVFERTKQLADLESLVSIEKNLEKLRSKYTSKLQPNKWLAKLKAQRSAAKMWDAYSAETVSYKKQRSKIQSRIDKLNITCNEDAAKAIDAAKFKLEAEKGACQILTEKLDSLKSEEKQFNDLQQSYSKLRRKIEEHGEKLPVESVESELAGLRATLRLQKLLESHDDCSTDSSKCPTCLSDVDLHSIRRAVQHAKKKIPALEHILELQHAAVELKAVNRSLLALHYDELAVDKAKRALVKRTATVESLSSELENLRKFKQLSAELAELEQPERPKEEKPELSVDEINESIDLCSDVLKYLEAKQSLVERAGIEEMRSLARLLSKIESSKSELAALEAKKSKQEEELAHLSQIIDRYRSKTAEIELYDREVKEAEAEIEKLTPSVEHKQVVDALLKAYSTKGIKAKVADHICTLLETNLNTYRELIFAENFKFAVDSTDTGISIRVDRGNNHESDVRMLSAAEGDCFTCLFTLALLPLIPDNRRLNFLILDEPMCHAHEVTRQIFRERFLPVLCEVVPHVVVITQNDDDFIEGSRKLYVVKEKGVSYLEEDETVAE